MTERLAQVEKIECVLALIQLSRGAISYSAAMKLSDTERQLAIREFKRQGEDKNER